MLSCDYNEKIFQTLPGQGWQALIEWNVDAVDAADGSPAMTLEPVVAWETARVQRKATKGTEYESVIIAPLVRYPSGGELVLVLLDRMEDYPCISRFVYLAPGEELSLAHFERLKGGYAADVSGAAHD